MSNVLIENDYEEIKKTIVSVFEDYNISSFPINTKELAKKMGCLIIPYSNFKKEESDLLCKFSNDGFSMYKKENKRYVIWYNDKLPESRQRFTFGHEIIHIIRGHFEPLKTNNQEDEANFGAGYLLAPTICYKFLDYNDPYIIMDKFGVSYECSRSIHNRFVRRKAHGENIIYDYEEKIIDLFFKNKF